MASLTLLRQIDPSESLLKWLESGVWVDKDAKKHPHVITLEDGTHYVDDAGPRPDTITQEIVGEGVGKGFTTVGWVAFDDEMNRVGKWRDLSKAQAAVGGAKFRFETVIDVDSEDESWPEQSDVVTGTPQTFGKPKK